MERCKRDICAVATSSLRMVLMDTKTVFVLLLSALLCRVVEADPRTVELHTYLFKDYHKEIRPVVNSTTVINLNFQFFIFNILDMDERSQTLSCSTWLTLIWRDEYMTWDPEEYGGLTNTKVNSNSLWLPDLYFYNNAGELYHNFMKDTIIKVNHDGELLWASPVNFRSFCRLDVRYFPFDHQICEMKFGPWASDGNELVINGSGATRVRGDMSAFTGNGEWDMLKIEARNNVEIYPDDPLIPYTDVTFTIHFERRSQFYVFNLIMPATLITLMASLAFLLPPTSQGKINLGTTFMLSKTVFLMVVAESMPPTDTVPILGQYLASLMILVSLSLVLNVVVVMIYNKGVAGEPVRPWVKTLVFTIFAPMVFIRIPEPKKLQRNKSALKRLNTNNSNTLSPTQFNNISFTQLKSQTDYEQFVLNGNEYGGSYTAPENGNTHSGNEQAVVLELKRMNDLLTGMKQEKNNSNRREQAKATSQNDRLLAEWLLVTKILDRVFFTTYVLACFMAGVYLVIKINAKQQAF